MPCFKPLQAWRMPERNPATGKRVISFSGRGHYQDRPGDVLELPCGQCIGCRLERSRQWAIRCVHEAQLHEKNCFITLTYNSDHLPSGGTLVLKHFQDFMKRLRFHHGNGIRFFHCGEYGERGGRPHYHACLFNFDFDDKVLWKVERGVKLYVSETLKSLWGLDGVSFGFSTIGEVTFESAAYVARYVTKKITGSSSDEHYAGRKPEYVTMSRRPGIAAGWFAKFGSDVFPLDHVVLRGREMRPPRFYDLLFERAHASGYAKLKRRRLVRGRIIANRELLLYKPGDVPRLVVREQVQLLRFKQLIRGYESGKT